MQRRTYPFVSVILSPGSKIGHTPRKNPSAYRRTATSRINAYRGLRRTLVTFRPSLSQPRMIIAHVSRRCKCFLGDFLNFFEKILRFAERRFPMSPEGVFRFAPVLRCSQAPVFRAGGASSLPCRRVRRSSLPISDPAAGPAHRRADFERHGIVCAEFCHVCNTYRIIASDYTVCFCFQPVFRQLGRSRDATRQPVSEGSSRTMEALAVSGV